MVTVYGNSISGGFTSGTPLVAVYTYGCQVWPSEESWTGPWPGPEAHPGDYYISWTPTSAEGVFSIAGSNYYLDDYNGYFDDFSGTITYGAFSNLSLSSLETTATRIDAYAFYSNLGMSTVNLPHCSYIGYAAFSLCGARSVSLPECTYISDSAFDYNGTGMSQLYLPKVEYIGQYAFRGNFDLRYIRIGSNCSMIGSHAFESIAQYSNLYVQLDYQGIVGFGQGAIGGIYRLYVPGWLKSAYSGMASNITGTYYISFPGFYEVYGGIPRFTPNIIDFTSLTQVETDAYGTGTSMFQSCSLLSSVSLPHCVEIGTNTFTDCTSLESVYMPYVSIIRDWAFTNCISLKSVDLLRVSFFGRNPFYGCSNLSSVTLWYSSVCSMEDTSLFPFIGCHSNLSIYVPSSLYSDYLISPGWSSYSSRIFPIGYTPPSTETLDFSNSGLTDREVVDGRSFQGYNFTLVFTGGTSTKPTYYAAGGGAVRIYGGGSVTIESNDYISSVEFTWLSTYKPTEDVATPSGYDTTTSTWTGNSKTVTLTKPSGTGNWRLHSVTINYA